MTDKTGPEFRIDPSVPIMDVDALMHHTELPATRVSRAVDPVIRAIGQASAWAWVALLLVIIANVVMRYVFQSGLILFEELQWHLYAVGFLVGIAWVLEADDHVRIDVLAERWSFRTRCWIEFAGITTFLLPFLVLVLWYSLPFVAYSFRVNEISEAPGGLPWRWAIKSVLVFAFALLACATFSRLTRVWAALFTRVTAPARS